MYVYLYAKFYVRAIYGCKVCNVATWNIRVSYSLD